VPDFRGNHTKSSRTVGSFGAVLTDQVAGSRTNKLCPEYNLCRYGGDLGERGDLVVLLDKQEIKLHLAVTCLLYEDYNFMESAAVNIKNLFV